MFKTRRDSQAGFTLIELLVVIAIIGLLSSVVLASLNGARERARDARRLADMQQLRVALELYYSANNRYPNYSTDANYFLRLVQGLAPDHIAVLPSDPLWAGQGNDYRYLSNPPIGYVLLLRNEANNTWCRIVSASGLPGWWGNWPLCSSL